MRQHKYRVYDKANKRMVYFGGLKPCIAAELVDSEIVCNIQGWGDPYKIETPPDFSELMQFTGRLDKNQKEVYANDILKVPNEVYRMSREHGWPGNEDGLELVYWDDRCSSFMSKDLDHLKGGTPVELISGRYLWMLKIVENSEVIGNLLENPELLEDK